MNINFDKQTGLVPAIVQDCETGRVLMLGYMNREAFDKTLETKKVTFFSRSRQKLWTKGEESGHFLHLVGVKNDCDDDTLLVKVHPQGPTCHTGTDTCWGEKNEGFAAKGNFIFDLQRVIEGRKGEDPEKSYVARLFSKGTNKVAQKVGEEAVEVVIEAMSNNDDLFLNEAADLLFHYMVMLTDRGYAIEDVAKILEGRHK